MNHEYENGFLLTMRLDICTVGEKDIVLCAVQLDATYTKFLLSRINSGLLETNLPMEDI